MTPEEREERLQGLRAARAKSWATYARNHPERVALIEQVQAAIASGEIIPQPCDMCGTTEWSRPWRNYPDSPAYDPALGLVRSWRCHECWKEVHADWDAIRAGQGKKPRVKRQRRRRKDKPTVAPIAFPPIEERVR